MKAIFITCLFLPLWILMSCSSSDPDPITNVEILSSTINGANTAGQITDVQIDVEIAFVFSAEIDQGAFKSAFTIAGGTNPVSYSLTFSNASTKVTATMELAYHTAYVVTIDTNPIGANGERLSAAHTFDFLTAEDDISRSMQPCTNVGDCLRSVELQGSEGNGTFEFYSNYPIYEEAAQWEDLTTAVIVVHGASHNPADYYAWMSNTFQSENISANTILIAPFFRNTSTGSSEDFYWANTNWRRGSPSSNSNKLSSFEAIDSLIHQLANKERFPVLKKIIVTGHSSGAAFTHVYAAANSVEDSYPAIAFDYVVANSQFFYYPDGQRINESTNQLYTPTDCSAYDIWPLGYNATPLYLAGVSASSFNDQLISRQITYLLGNGNQADPTLNTSNCENVLQGSTRYKRGENMHRYMELMYPGNHQHTKTIVNGIGHDGQGMYQSSEFRALLLQLLSD